MIPLHSLLLYCGIYAVAIATPGPGIFAIIARALSGGFRSTVPAVLGNTLGDLILMSLSERHRDCEKGGCGRRLFRELRRHRFEPGWLCHRSRP